MIVDRPLDLTLLVLPPDDKNPSHSLPVEHGVVVGEEIEKDDSLSDATQQHAHGAYGRRKHHQWDGDHYHGWHNPPLDGGFSKAVLVGV
jgi:hypothetical protein